MMSTIAMALMLTMCKHKPDILVTDTIGTSFCTEPAGDTLCEYNWLVPEPATFYVKQLHAGINYMCPSVNPNNPNQFVCFKQNYSFPSECSIITYDMTTNTEKVLFSFTGPMIGNLNWGKKDWIAYTTGPGTIRIFKSDGTCDHQLMASSSMNFGGGAGPAWSADGAYLFCNGLNKQPQGTICDTMGTIISTHQISAKPSWNSDNIILGGGDIYNQAKFKYQYVFNYYHYPK